MRFLRNHWYDIGAVFALIIVVFLFVRHGQLTSYQWLMWASLASLLLHQVEEYRFPGTFPGMINTVMYKSPQPDRYPLNPNTSLMVNVGIGWTTYLLAAVFAEKAVWLGVATMLVSLGNVIAHTLLFNLKGPTLYNAGMLSSCLLFVPCLLRFVYLLRTESPGTTSDYLTGLALGIALNGIGILKMIDWMADAQTAYIFPKRNLLTPHS